MSGVLLDTSVLIAEESGRPLRITELPDVAFVSAITIGELRLGVLAASPELINRRLRTLSDALTLGPLPVDEPVADAWAELQAQLRVLRRRMPANDAWIAATALAHDLPIATQDADYDGVPGLSVIKV